MKLYHLKHVLLLLLAMILASCNVKSRQTTPLQPVSTPMLGDEIPSTKVASRSHNTDIQARIVTSGLEIVDFGWLPDGRIYYGVGAPILYGQNWVSTPVEIDWYAYDSKNGLNQLIGDTYRGGDKDLIEIISQNGTINILSTTTSPEADGMIFTRLPIGYVRPTPSPHYFDPSEMWAVRKHGQEIFPLLDEPENWFNCGFALSKESFWFHNDTIVIGSCQFTYGITQVYFLADLVTRRIQFLDFELPDGEYLPTEEIAVAHNNPSLAFPAGPGLWVVPVESSQGEINTKLSRSNLLFEDRPAIAPIWSSDDKWIYYWTFDLAVTVDQLNSESDKQWRLERINTVTLQRQVMLSEDELSSSMGTEMYQWYAEFGLGNHWRLSPDGNQVLLFLYETAKSPAKLFLYSW